MPKSNRERVLIIAEALGELCDRVVFVGGSVSQFYCDDMASSEPRPTDDVDCIVDLSSYASYMRFCEEELVSRRIHNDIRSGAPLCRFVYDSDDNVVDIMPTEDTGIGESNRWYKPGFAFRKAFELSSERVIYLMPVLYYIASKLEALNSRGGNDYRGAKDFEDIIFVLNTCRDIHKSFERCIDRQLLMFLSESFGSVLKRPNVDEEIECALYSGEEDRTEYVKNIMRILSSYNGGQ